MNLEVIDRLAIDLAGALDAKDAESTECPWEKPRGCFRRLPKPDGVPRRITADLALWLNGKLELCFECRAWALASVLEGEVREKVVTSRRAK